MSETDRWGGAAEAPVELRILGPVQVWAGGRRLAVDRPLERAVLVRLGLARGMPVPDGRLAADLWGEGELRRPIPRLRVLISRLRAALGEHNDAVRRTSAGYRARVVVTDLVAAEAAADRMHAARRAGRHEDVRVAADDAVSRWRAPALADLLALPFAQAEAARLTEWRLGLTVTGLDAAVRAGADADVVAELAALVAEHPLHEPLARLHAIAVYRNGSPPDALHRLHRLRRALADELGMDPSPETAELEVRMLNHDPSLRVPARPPTPPLTPAGTDGGRALCGPADLFVGRTHKLSP
ncbi:AfsR/SARP family transcriptional regulator [Nocardia sp. NPDC003482]